MLFNILVYIYILLGYLRHLRGFFFYIILNPPNQVAIEHFFEDKDNNYFVS